MNHTVFRCGYLSCVCVDSMMDGPLFMYVFAIVQGYMPKEKEKKV